NPNRPLRQKTVPRLANGDEKSPSCRASIAAITQTLGNPSSNYAERGFKEFSFGSSPAALKRQVGEIRPDPTAPGWFVASDNAGLLFSDRNQLVGVGKYYSGRNEVYLEQLRDLFGPASKRNIETFGSVQKLWHDPRSPHSQDIALRLDHMQITYHFESSIVVV